MIPADLFGMSLIIGGMRKNQFLLIGVMYTSINKELMDHKIQLENLLIIGGMVVTSM